MAMRFGSPSHSDVRPGGIVQRRNAWIAGVLFGVLALAGCGGGEPVSILETYDADRIVIDDFIGTLTIETAAAGDETELRADLRQDQLALLPISLDNGTLRMEWLGEPDRERRWWEFWRGRWMADPDRLGNYPNVTLTVPADVTVEVHSIIGQWTVGDRQGHLVLGADNGRGTIGATQTAEIAVSGDADVTLGPVAGLVEIAISGSGSVIGGNAGEAIVAIAGSGSLELGNVAGALTVAVAGSGEAEIADAASAEVTISGSGDVELGAVSGAFNAVVLGSGEIDAQSVEGAFYATVSGSGDITVEDGRGSPFEVTIAGSGNVRFEGTGVDVVASLAGSGNLFLGTLEGELTSRTSGSGRVDIGNR